jgi:putative ABC transport system substrate-binding protein
MIRRLGPGIVLIGFASGVLLLSDWDQRRKHAAGGRLPRVAILQHASQQLLEDGVRGMLEGLAAAGFEDRRNVSIERFNAENDVGVSNAIARQLVAGRYDLVLTSSTRSLQAVANANRGGQVRHIFGIVADPASAGVGVSRIDPFSHPRHMSGIGSFVPVDKAFELARRMHPGLRSVGAAWNPSEANSEAFTLKAREAARQMGIELLETAIDNSAAVGEAVESLVARGAEAIWVGGDVTVLVAADQVLAAARKGRIPVFSIAPPVAVRGALFDRGADFYEVGKETGALAAEVLRGADIARIPVRNSVPQKLVVNTAAVQGLKAPWRIPRDVLEEADEIVDGQGSRLKPKGAKKPGREN